MNAALATAIGSRSERCLRLSSSHAVTIWNHPASANPSPSAIDSPACGGTITRWITPAAIENDSRDSEQ